MSEFGGKYIFCGKGGNSEPGDTTSVDGTDTFGTGFGCVSDDAVVACTSELIVLVLTNVSDVGATIGCFGLAPCFPVQAAHCQSWAPVSITPTHSL